MLYEGRTTGALFIKVSLSSCLKMLFFRRFAHFVTNCMVLATLRTEFAARLFLLLRDRLCSCGLGTSRCTTFILGFMTGVAVLGNCWSLLNASSSSSLSSLITSGFHACCTTIRIGVGSILSPAITEEREAHQRLFRNKFGRAKNLKWVGLALR